MNRCLLIFLTLFSLPYSIFLYMVARVPIPRHCRWIFRFFGQMLGIKLDSAKVKDWRDYKTFLEVFVREPEHITPSNSPLISPCEGTVYQINGVGIPEPIKAGYEQMIKSIPFSVRSSIGIYLSPSDFHLFYSPADGEIRNVFYQGWILSSVNHKSKFFFSDSLFINKRVYLYFATSLGKLCMILVGALGVGKINLARAALNLPTKITRGDYLGRFELGSFIWLVMEERIDLDTNLIGRKISIGQGLLCPEVGVSGLAVE